jgi:hypothetical protein
MYFHSPGRTLDRLTDFWEQHYRLQASALNALVRISRSNKDWSYDLRVDLLESAMSLLHAEKDESASVRRSGITKVAISGPLFLIPVLGRGLPVEVSAMGSAMLIRRSAT